MRYPNHLLPSGKSAVRITASVPDGNGGRRSRSVVRMLRVAVVTGAVAFGMGAASASATVVTVALAGSGTGSVVSKRLGLNCSNIPGAIRTDCTFDFPNAYSGLELVANAGPHSALMAWGGTGAGTCGSGVVNPCTTNLLVYLPASITVTATFGPKPSAPMAVTGGASDVVFPSARLSGEANPNSNAFAVSDCRFEYGLTTAYGRWKPCRSILGKTGTSPVGVSTSIGVLEPGETYHYRLAVTNGGGTTYGQDRTVIGAAAPVDSCPNAAVRAQQGALGRALPDCRAYELVSPELTSGAPAVLSTVSADGEHGVLYSIGGFADTAQLALQGMGYLTARTGQGWVTSSIAPSAKDTPYSGYTVDMSTDLKRSLWSVNMKADEGTDRWTPLLGMGNNVFQAAGPSVAGSQDSLVAGASGDLETVVVSTMDRSVVNDGTTDVRGTTSNAFSLYAMSPRPGGLPVVRQVAYRAGATLSRTCGITLGGAGTSRGGISADGSKIFFQTTGLASCAAAANRRMWVKVGDAEPFDLAASRCDDGNCGTTQPAEFQGASRDGSRAYFTTQQKLVNGDRDTADKNDLYEYDFDATDHELRSVTASADPAGAGVVRVTRISEDGSHVYFVANRRPLAGANARGATPVSGDQNLYVYHRPAGQAGGEITFIGKLDASADSALWGTEKPAYTSTSGRFLVFRSAANLTGEKLAGDAFQDMYRYDTQNDELRRIWTNEPAHNGASRTAAVALGGMLEVQGSGGGFNSSWNKTRVISDDGATIAFSTTEPLSPLDGNTQNDVYLWRADTGRFTMLTDGTPDHTTGLNASAVTGFQTMSASGDSVFFGSYRPLLASHVSGQAGTFVVRVGGGFLEPEVPPVCAGDACQGPMALASGPFGSAGTSTFSGGGNLTPPGADARQETVQVVKVEAARGPSRWVRVAVPARGRIQVTGAGLSRASKAAGKAGTYRMKVRLSRRAQRTLERKHQVKAQMRVAFAPAQGASSVARVSVAFKTVGTSRTTASPAQSSAKGGR